MLQGRSAIQKDLSKVEETTDRKLLKSQDKCENFLSKGTTPCSCAGGQGPLCPGEQQMDHRSAVCLCSSENWQCIGLH